MVLKSVIYNKFQYFTQDEKSYLQKILGSHQCCTVNDRQEFILLKIWKAVDQNTTQFQKDLLIDLVERLYIEHDVPVLHIAARGENVRIDITLDDDDDFTSSILLARNAEDKAALSDETLAGTSDPIQTVTLLDLDLPAEDFAKVLILTETPDGSGNASGNVHALINEVFMYVSAEIDSDTV